MKKSIFFKLLILFIILISLFFIVRQNRVQDGSNASTQGKVQRGDLVQRVTIAGNIIPLSKTIITAPFNGYIKKLYIKVGDEVKKGDPLVSIAQSLQSIESQFPLRSPLAGTVVSVNKQEGEYVKQDDAQEFILRVDNMNELYITSNVSELDMVKIKPGLDTIIKVSALYDKEYLGKVVNIDLASVKQDGWNDGSKVEYTARIKIMNPDSDLRPGMSTIIDFVTFKKEDILILPYEYILKEEKNFYVILEGGKRRKIEVGLQNETYFEITAGLNEGDVVQQIDFLNLLTQKIGE